MRSSDGRKDFVASCLRSYFTRNGEGGGGGGGKKKRTKKKKKKKKSLLCRESKAIKRSLF